MKIDVMLSDSVVGAAARARALDRTGVDGVFNFENSHDLFFPLVAAAPVCSLDLMTNVAIAFPRSPTRLAHAAYDLHLHSQGRFRLGLGTMPAIQKGLAAAGPQRTDIEVTVEVIVGVGRTDEEVEAARALRSTLAFYGSTPAYRAVLDTEGAGELQPELNALSKQGRWAEMTSLVTDDLMHTIAVLGNPREVAAEIIRRYGDCDRVCTYFPGYRPGDDLIADLAAALHG